MGLSLKEACSFFYSPYLRIEDNMYIPLHQLYGYDPREKNRVQGRWQNTEAEDLVLELIRNGGGEDFLQWEYENGILSGFLDDPNDLKGIILFQETIDFPYKDNFEKIDFSYSEFYHSTFRKASFFGTNSNFARIYNCKFINCRFHFAYWYGCNVENTTFENCDFIERHGFTNCDFINCKFVNYSVSELLFTDCRFDPKTEIENPKFSIISNKGRSSNFDKKKLCDYFRSISEAYTAGNVPGLSKKFKFLSEKNRTDYINENRFTWLKDKLFREYLTGYGLKPERPLIASILTVIFFSFLYGLNTIEVTSKGFFNTLWEIFAGGFWFSLAAFTKLGSISELSYPNNLYFLIQCSVHAILFALFITTLWNAWFKQ